MKKTTVLLSALALAVAAPGFVTAQETKPAEKAPAAEAAKTAPANPISAGAKMTYGMVSSFITKSAAKMPEENYSFKATPEVKSFAQILGHVADSNYYFCSQVAGEKPPAGGPDNSIEKTKSTKADLEKALADAFAYCSKVYAAMDDKSGAETMKFFGGNEMAKISILEMNTHHTFEHYGNVITYLRLKGLVPPSSEGRM